MLRCNVAAISSDGVPNDVGFDASGHLFVTDSVRGVIYRVSRVGGVEEWLSDTLLQGEPDPQPPHPPFPVGANGLAFHEPEACRLEVFIANSDYGRIVRVPVEPDGRAGAPEVYVEHPLLWAADGVVVDAEGSLYIAVIGQNTIVRVSPQKDIEVIADEDDGLDGPSSLRFGTLAGEESLVYFVNYAFLSFNTGGAPRPSLMRADVGTTEAVLSDCRPSFRRGDTNVDGRLDVSDAINVLNFLFFGRPAVLPCEKSADTDESGDLDLSDATSLIVYLFSGGPAPNKPFDACGRDPTEDVLSCEEFSVCD